MYFVMKFAIIPEPGSRVGSTARKDQRLSPKIFYLDKSEGIAIKQLCMLVAISSLLSLPSPSPSPPSLSPSLPFSLQVLVGMMHKIYSMDRHVETFFIHFNRHYADALATDFGDLSLQQQVAYVRMLYKVHVLMYN
jgi:hypothetical protein